MTDTRSGAYCVRSSVYPAMASSVEAQTAEEANSLSKTESYDRKPGNRSSQPTYMYKYTYLYDLVQFIVPFIGLKSISANGYVFENRSEILCTSVTLVNMLMT